MHKRRSVSSRDAASRLGPYKNQLQQLWYRGNLASGEGTAADRAAFAELLEKSGHRKQAQEFRQGRGNWRKSVSYETNSASRLWRQKLARTLFGAPQSRYSVGTERKSEKTGWIAHVPKGRFGSGNWLRVDRIKGDPGDGEPYFIGPGSGYDVQRLVVFARDESDAIEIAEETWPWLMFDEISAEEAEDDERAQPLKRHGDYFHEGWGVPTEDIRIFGRARLERARLIGNREARLRDGTVVEYN